MPLVDPLPSDASPEVAELALFGFLNRWNDSMATSLERGAEDIGVARLSASGWTRGKHA